MRETTFDSSHLQEADTLNVLILGTGGREHALAWKLAQAERIGRIVVAGGNGGTIAAGWTPDLANRLNWLDPIEVGYYAQSINADLVVPSTDRTLAAGMVDTIEEVFGIAAFGPTQAASQLEWSKSFSKKLMVDEGIPTAPYQEFYDAQSALTALENMSDLPKFIKEDGLAGGKGVTKVSSREEARAQIERLLGPPVTASGDCVLIEDRTIGREASLHSVSDGTTVLHFPPSEDHKQLYDGDKGPMTGGMGGVVPIDWMSPEKTAANYQTFVNPIIPAMRRIHRSYRGILYPGIMGNSGLEYNARFGDPEAQLYLRLMKSDLLEMMVASVVGTLDSYTLDWHAGHVAIVMSVAEGYPAVPRRGDPITGLNEDGELYHEIVFHSGTDYEDGAFYTNGGRVIGSIGAGETVDDAIEQANANAEMVTFAGRHKRTDIGRRPAPTD